LILLRQKRGRGRARICNSDCYDARSKECHCVCGGLNHGVGEEQARKNGKVWFEKVAARDPSLEVVRHQAELFEDVT